MLSSTLHTNDYHFHPFSRLEERVWLPIKIWLYRLYIGRFIIKKTSIKIAKHQESLTKELNGMLEAVKVFTAETALQKLDGFNACLKQFKDLTVQFDDVSYFDNKRLEKAFNTNFRILYKIESTLRKKAFSKMPKENRVKYEFMNELTQHSFNSLRNT